MHRGLVYCQNRWSFKPVVRHKVQSKWFIDIRVPPPLYGILASTWIAIGRMGDDLDVVYFMTISLVDPSGR